MSFDDSTVVVAGDDALATDFNGLRKSAIRAAGDYAAATGSANAFVLAIDSQYAAYAAGDMVRFQANHAVIAGGVTINVNTIGAVAIKSGGFDLSALDIISGDFIIMQYNGTNFDIMSISRPPPEQIIRIVFGNSTVYNLGQSRWVQLFDNNKKFLTRDVSVATEINYLSKPTKHSVFLGAAPTARAGLAITPNIACGVLDGTTEYLLAADDGGATIKQYDNDGQNEAAVTFSGTAPTAIRRMGYDAENGYVLIMDGASKAATQIRRYTYTGTVLTNINSDITLSVAPAAAGSGNMYIGLNYIVLTDDIVNIGNYVRYNKTNGTKIDDTVLQWDGGSGELFVGLCPSSPAENRLYLFVSAAGGSPGKAYLALYDIG